MRLCAPGFVNSLALRIPKSIAQAAGVGQGTEVDVTVEAGRLVAEPVTRVPTLDELLAGFKEGDEGRYEDVVGAVGAEAWPDDEARGVEVVDVDPKPVPASAESS